MYVRLRPLPALLSALGLAALAFAAVASAQISAGADLTDADCALCHDGAEEEIPAVTPASLTGSAHDGFGCLDCHADVTEVPHDEHLQPVSCGGCHEDMAAKYTRHGLGVVGEDPDLPTCATCHGSHEIRSSSDPASITHASRRPQVCAQCHGNIDWAKEHDIRLKRVVETYQSSVHGLAHQADSTSTAAMCSDCHGTGRDVHLILPAGDSESAINHFNIPETCGYCHEQEAADYWAGAHGELAARGDVHTPVCTDCHGEHGILAPDDPRSNVSPFRVAEATCTPCHEMARINERYDAPVGASVRFVDSFHGLKSQAGDVTVANCASCHEAHRTLPASDPRSSVHPENLAETCGKCHPGIDAEIAQVPIHASTQDAGWPAFFRNIYIALIVAVIGGMLAYVLLDFRRQAALRLAGPQVVRMDKNAVWQHTLLMTSFIVLVLTGFALRYSEYFPFRWLFGWDGGFDTRGLIHRIAAVVFLFATLWHVVYLFRPAGRSFLSAMLPGARDVRELDHAVRFNLGKSRHHPHFGRFSFVEKAEYWALVWGTVVMAGTGFLLWFRNDVIGIVSREFLQVMRVIHLYEAWLATLAILIWHMYSTVLKPGVYPGNPAWIHGRMPRAMWEEEHAGEAHEQKAAKEQASRESAEVGAGRQD